MTIQFIQYPKCGTCRNAKKYMEEKGAAMEERHIVEHPPTKEELKDWIQKSGLDIRKWFNTSGRKYKELGLKDKLKNMNTEDMLDLLASDGMLVKRPIVIQGDRVTVGFKPEQVDEVIERS